MELLKAAELRNYFRDECVAEIESKRRPLDAVATGAAIVYPIIFEDRLELIVTLPSGIERFTSRVDSARLNRTAAEFREFVLTPPSRRYRIPGTELYEWLVGPYTSWLAQENVTTLVFVPDGVLRTIPLGAIWNGERFLIEDYAIAVTPGLSLVDPKPIDIRSANVLLAGLSEESQGFGSIPYAARELESIHAIVGGDILIDDSFESQRFADAVEREQPSIVHVASHAVFSGDPSTSFVLTHDSRLTMDEISEVVRPTQFRNQPLELLALSACETAVGDERAALGLAGVAIRAGARSALGSLWRIQDEAAYEIAVGFYEGLERGDLSKAQALRQAQRRLLASPAFSHPYYWSGYLLISNWL
jgi:CHAT domain-containing protein